MIRAQCNCGAKINAKDTWAGKTGKCPKCGQPVLIPAIAPDVAAIVEPVVPLTPVLAQTQQPIRLKLPQGPLSNSPPPSRPILPLVETAKNQEIPFYIDGKQIVGKSPIILRNCIVCGSELAPAEIKTKTLYYYPLLARLMMFIFLPLGLIFRKKCKISYGRCAIDRTFFGNRIYVTKYDKTSEIFWIKGFKFKDGFLKNSINATGVLKKGVTVFCSKCGNQMNDGTAFCAKCGTKSVAPASTTSQFLEPQSISASTGNPYSTVGIVLGVISFLFFPILFGPVGMILGAVGKSKGESKAVLAMVVSGLGLVVGMILGAMLA